MLGQYVFHCVDPARTVGQTDVGQNKLRRILLRIRNRFAMRPYDRCNRVPKAFDNLFDVQGDNRLVFNDQDLGRKRIFNAGLRSRNMP